MASNRIIMKLGDFIELKRGYDLPKKQRVNGPYPIVSSSGIRDWHAEAKVAAPGVVTGRYGTIGNVYYVAEDFWPLNTALYVRDFKGADPRFVAYFLHTLDFHAYSDKAAVPGVNRNHLHLAKVRVPPTRAEQEAIAAVLGALDDKVELNCRRAEKLEAVARALFRAWFIDFEIDAKLVDSPIGPIPIGWGTGTVADLMEFAYGKSLPKKARVPGAIPVYGSGGLSGYHNESLVSEPTVIVGRKGTIGSLDWVRRPSYPIDTVFFVRSKVPLSFCYYLLETLGLENMNTDAAVPGLNRNNAYRLQVIMPPAPWLARFNDIVAPMVERADRASRENQILRDLRDTLLPKLISGDVGLPNAERLVVEAT